MTTGIIKLASKHRLAAIALALIFVGGPLAGIYFTKKPNVNTTQGQNSPNVTGDGNANGTGNAAIAKNINSGNQQIAPGASNPQQFNITTNTQSPIVTGGNPTIIYQTVNNFAPQTVPGGGTIPDTSISSDELDRQFPFGWVIFDAGGKRAYLPNKPDEIVWSLALEKIEIRWSSQMGKAFWRIPEFDIQWPKRRSHYQSDGEIIACNFKTGATCYTPTLFAESPNLCFRTLRVDAKSPIFLMGFQFLTKEYVDRL